jgi:ribonuclease HI
MGYILNSNINDIKHLIIGKSYLVSNCNIYNWEKLAKEHKITCKNDSELIIKQIIGKYQVKATNLIPLHNTVKMLEQKFDEIKYEHVKREFNKRADKLANMALDKKTL